ncbi:MAG: type II secretion system protein GspM [Burkholderiaceae bacterium]
MIEKFFEWWRSLARREKRMLIAGVSVIVLAIVYLGLFEPAWKGRRQLEAELPQLRAQVAQIDAMSVEARRLAALPSGNDSPHAMRQAFESSIDAAGMRPYVSQIKLSGEVLDVRFKEVPFAAWIDWADAALRETRLRVVDAAIQREAQLGKVSVRLSLEAPRREDR